MENEETIENEEEYSASKLKKGLLIGGGIGAALLVVGGGITAFVLARKGSTPTYTNQEQSNIAETCRRQGGTIDKDGFCIGVHISTSTPSPTPSSYTPPTPPTPTPPPFSGVKDVAGRKVITGNLAGKIDMACPLLADTTVRFPIHIFENGQIKAGNRTRKWLAEQCFKDKSFPVMEGIADMRSVPLFTGNIGTHRPQVCQILNDVNVVYPLIFIKNRKLDQLITKNQLRAMC